MSSEKNETSLILDILNQFPVAPSHPIYQSQTTDEIHIQPKKTDTIKKHPKNNSWTGTLNANALASLKNIQSSFSLMGTKEKSIEIPISVTDPEDLKFDIPTGLPQEDYLELFQKACKGEISENERKLFYDFLLLLPLQKMTQLQKAVHNLLLEKETTASKSSKSKLIITALQLSKYHLEFGIKDELKLNTPETDSIMIQSPTGKAKFSLQTDSDMKDFSLTVDTGKAKITPTDVKFKLILKKHISVKKVIQIIVEEGFSHFIILDIHGEQSNFGLSISEYNQIEDLIGKRSLKIPEPLVLLRRLLNSNDKIKTEELFTKQIDEETLIQSKKIFDQKKDQREELSAIVLANLLKQWFREIPEKLFDTTVENVFKCEKVIDYIEMLQLQKSLRKDILIWLFLFFKEEVLKHSENRMTIKKLALVFAPNLFPSSNVQKSEYYKKQVEIFSFILEKFDMKLMS